MSHSHGNFVFDHGPNWSSKIDFEANFSIPIIPFPSLNEVGLIGAEVSEDDPSNVILATEAGCIVMTDLNSELTLVSVATSDQEQVRRFIVRRLHCNK